MMFPFRRRTTSKSTAEKHAPKLNAENPPNVTELHLQHLDYNGEPMSVESLSHYFAPTDSNERFRVH
ncbi:hypothetical protein [Dyella sp.]|uniref:hypothetical protein n=1 Tax=Dyella sp. TaxID=1869338 RepID=UPI002B46F636|nr:hypothetical protein [Dyella sp.]HKT30152.1 hypothetical protein [Dyella sp.]